MRPLLPLLNGKRPLRPTPPHHINGSNSNSSNNLQLRPTAPISHRSPHIAAMRHLSHLLPRSTLQRKRTRPYIHRPICNNRTLAIRSMLLSRCHSSSLRFRHSQQPTTGLHHCRSQRTSRQINTKLYHHHPFNHPSRNSSRRDGSPTNHRQRSPPTISIRQRELDPPLRTRARKPVVSRDRMRTMLVSIMDGWAVAGVEEE